MENGSGSIFCTLVEPILVNKITLGFKKYMYIWCSAGLTDKNARVSMNKKNEMNKK